nr:zinc finger MYM-type protein 1-like [Coffea arabica]
MERYFKRKSMEKESSNKEEVKDNENIQKDISNALASETTSIIVNDIGHGLFAILCDESRDASTKEQLAVVIRYVDSHGYVIERFLGILHVRDTTTLSLKKAIDVLFSKHGLSISQICGQGYDGASNMRGVAKKHVQVSSMYNTLSTLVHVLEGSSKRQEILREQRLKKVVDDLMTGDLVSGRGLNQETSLQRACDTHVGVHFGSLLKLVLMYDSVIDVLLIIENDENHGITNALSEALQRKDQDIVNAMGLVKVSKQQLQATRED